MYRLFIYIKILLFAGLLAQPQDGWTFQTKWDRELVARLQNVSAPKDFVKIETFAWSAKRGKVKSIIYGNEEVGFFESKNFTAAPKGLIFKFIPPTYKGPITFKAVIENGRQEVLRGKKFVSPLGEIVDASMVRTRLAVPFFLFEWVVKSSNVDRFVPVVMNRLGEIVWALSDPKIGEPKLISGYQVLDDGRIQFLETTRATRFVELDSWGNVLRNIDFRSNGLPGSSHTLQYLSETNEIVYLGYDCRELPWYREFIPFFSGPSGWLRMFTLPRRSYLGGKIIRLSLETMKAREIWNSYQNFAPWRDPSLEIGQYLSGDYFMNVNSAEVYDALMAPHTPLSLDLWFDWPDKQCHVDWTHENSVEYKKGVGYLVSIRNLNKIILLDESGKFKWSIGEGPENTYYFGQGQGAFSLQHSAKFMPDGRILLYDNHSSYLGQVGTRWGNRPMILDLKVPGRIQAAFQLRLPIPHSDVRGSVSLLNNGKIFTYSAGNPGERMYVAEVDPNTSEITGEILFGPSYGWKGNEAIPFYGFGGDRYIQPGGEKSIVVPGDHDPLEFGY